MREQNFLNKLFQEGKIRIVEPSLQVQNLLDALIVEETADCFPSGP